MSVLNRKAQYARSKGITIHKTESILRRNKAEMLRAALQGKSLSMSNFPKVVIIRNSGGKGAYTLNVGHLLMNPVGGLTYREAVNMAYEIAVNPSKAFKGVQKWQE